MQKRNKIGAIIALAVALAFVMPGSAAFANVGTIGVTSNSGNTASIKNMVETTNTDTKETAKTTNSDEVVTSDPFYTDIPMASNRTITDDDIVYGRYTYNADSAFPERDTASVVDTAIYVDNTEGFPNEALPLTGRTIYVDDDRPPEWYNATHVKTIQVGVYNATAGDTVYVYNGTYYDHVTVDKQLDLIGESRENVIVDGSGVGEVFYVTASDISMNNFTVTNGVYGIYLASSSNSVFTNLWVIYNIGTYGFYAASSNSVQIIGGNYSHNGNSADDQDGFNIYFINSNAVIIDTVTVDEPVQGGPAMSCPFLYLWNGKNYDYYTDLAGEPLGAPWFNPETYEAGIYELGDFASTDGAYKVKLREPIYESDFFDEAKLILVDVPKGYSVLNEWHIASSQQQAPPKDFMTIKDPRKPISAIDKYGNNVLSEVSEKDGVPLSTSYSDQNSVILDFGSIEHPECAKLIITGWAAYHLNAFSTVPQPYILLETLDGNEWKQSKIFGKLPGDSKTIVFDIAGILKEDNTKIRLTTDYTPAAVGIIDQVLLDDSEPVDITTTYLDPSYADIHWAGSTNYVYPSKDNRLSATDEQLPARRDALMYGNFTKYGNVLPPLDETDDRFVIMRHGDEVNLEFIDIPLNETKDRYVFLYADVMYSIKYTVLGFVTDSIYPLPYHGMKTYPYPEDEWKYKDDPDYQEYLDTWNTRGYQYESGCAYGIYLSSSNNAVINNVSGRATHDHPEFGFDEYGIYLSSSHYATLTNINGLTNWEYGIYLQSSTHSNIRECDIHDNNYGIYFSQSTGGNIKNCNFHNTSIKEHYGDSFGIYLESSSGTSIENCRLYNNSGLVFGICASNSPSCNIIDCEIYNNVGCGIYTINSPSCNIMGCEAYNNSAAPSIFLYNSPNSMLNDNTMYNNDYNFGITGPASGYYQYIDYSNTINGKPIYYIIGQCDTTFDETNNIGYLGLIGCMNITAKNLDVSGMLVVLTTDSTISNVCAHNAVNGIYLYESPNNNIVNCDTYDNMCGISLYYSDDNDIINCVSHDNPEYGILLNWVFNNNIVNCDVCNTSNLYGIYVCFSSDVNLIDCSIHDISGSRPGVCFMRSPNNNVMNCSFYNNSWNTQALNFQYSPECNITDCSLYDNEQGILFSYSPNCNVVDCQIYNNTVLPGIGSGGSGISIRDNSNNINIVNCDIYNNTNAGISVGSWLSGTTNITNCDIYKNGNYRGGVTGGMGQAIAILSSTTITNCRLYDSTRGIFFVSAPTCILRNNRIYNNVYNIGIPGTTLTHFNHNIDTSNTVDGKPIYYLVGESNRTLDETDNVGYLGLVSCTNITVKNSDVCGIVIAETTDSTISNINSHDNQDGAYLWGSSNNDIVDCNLYNNDFGSRIISSLGNSITNCTVLSNNKYGIWFQSTSKNNLIHHNNFANNIMKNAVDQGINTWDDGIAEGNYWSDYTGSDSNGDGIGDTPYNISGKTPPNKDRYPLMNPRDSVPPIITKVKATPRLQVINGSVNITCNVIDIQVDTVKVNISGPEGFTLEATMNVSMSSYWYETVYTLTGEYEYFVWANDTSGNIAISDTYSFVITEFDKPISTVNPLPLWKKAVPFTITATAHDNTMVENVTLYYRYSSNGTAWTNWTSYGTDIATPWSWSFTGADGYYQFYSIAVDDYGNVEEAPSAADASTGIDTVKPVTTIMLNGTMGGDGWYVSNVVVTLSATDSLSGIESTWYKIDAGYWTFYNNVPFTVSGEGQHTVQYYSIDHAGNQEVPKSVSFKIDTTAPTTTHTLQGLLGSQGWYVTNVTVTLSANDVTSGVNFTKYKLNTGDWIVYAGFFVVTTNGNYTLQYCSVDLAGNTEATKQAAFRIQHDVLPPVTTHEFDGVMGENNWFISAVTVTLSAVDDSAGVASTKYKLDAGPLWTTYTGAFPVTIDAEHTLYYYSVDKVGNREENKSVTLKIDRTAPTINLTVEKTGLNKWLLTATVSDETSGVAKVEFYVDGEFVGEVTEAPYELEYSGTGDTAQAIVYDNAGNSATSAEVKDQAAPDSQSQSSSSTSVSVSKNTIQGQSISSTLQRLFNLR